MAVFVLGMHRSGTSALAQIAGELGFTLPVDLIPPGPDNLEGFGESVSLTSFNDGILDVLGGAWHSPPACAQDWAPLAARVREQARETLLGAYPDAAADSRWAWKDPRLCIVLPMWRALFADASLRAVLVFRNPVSVARSLVAANRTEWRLHTLEFALALWERYTGCLLGNLRSSDEVLFTDFDRLVGDGAYREDWSQQLRVLLAPDVERDGTTVAAAVDGRLKPGLVSHRVEEFPVVVEQRELYRRLRLHADAFSGEIPVCPPESAETTALLEAHRACQQGECAHYAGADALSERP